MDIAEAYRAVAQFMIIMMLASGYFFFRHQQSLFAKYAWRLMAATMAIILVVDLVFNITRQ